MFCTKELKNTIFGISHILRFDFFLDFRLLPGEYASTWNIYHERPAGPAQIARHLTRFSISNGTVLENVFPSWFQLTGAVEVKNKRLTYKSHFEALIVPLSKP